MVFGTLVVNRLAGTGVIACQDFLLFGGTDEPISRRLLQVVNVFGSSRFHFLSGRKLKVG